MSTRPPLHRRCRVAFFLTLVSVVALPLAGAQVRVNWSRTVGFGSQTSSSCGTHIAPHPVGGYIVGGWMREHFVDVENPVVMRLDAQGGVTWSRVLYTPSGARDWVSGLAVGSSGNAYCATSSAGITSIIRVFKFDAAGNAQWSASPSPGTVVREMVGPATSNEPLVDDDRVLLDAAENIYVGGTRFDFTTAIFDMLVLSYDSNGALRFSQTVDGPLSGRDEVQAICRDSAGNLFAVGSMDGDVGNNASHLGIAKLSSTGAVLWTRALDLAGSPGSQSFSSAVCDAAGNVYACGDVKVFVPTFIGFGVVVSFDPQGQVRWIRQLPGVTSNATKVAMDPWGRLIVIGWSDSGTGLLQYDAIGNLLWSQLTGGTDLVVDGNGDITITNGGSSVSQLSPVGSARWTRTVGSSQPDRRTARLCLGADGRVAFTGWTGNQSNSDFDTFTVELGDQSQPFCFGDGTATACPCGNASAAGAQAGCLNSNAIGAQLSDAGDASIANDTLTLTATDVTGPAFFVQGSGQIAGGVVFGDGLLCLGGTITRLGVVFPTGTTAAYPGGTTPNPIHIGGMTAAGDSRHYQSWYRDAAVFCSAATFNLTQGLSVTWSP